LTKKLNTLANRQTWALRYGMTPEQLEALATRELRISKFKQLTWGPKLESYFLSYKSQLDKVIYSVIRTKDRELPKNSIHSGRRTILCRSGAKYSQGPEAYTCGLLGPRGLDPSGGLGQPLAPFELGGGGRLNEPMRHC